MIPNRAAHGTTTSRRCALVAAALLVLLSGCAAGPARLADAFPRAAAADPWRLDGEVWSGTFADAVYALGDEAGAWSNLEPQWVWLAIYRHAEHPDARLIVRVFQFADVAGAQRACTRFLPLNERPFQAGDQGFWLDDGVMFRRGRLVFEYFGSGDLERASPEQAVYLVGLMERKLSRGVAEESP